MVSLKTSLSFEKYIGDKFFFVLLVVYANEKLEIIIANFRNQ